MKKGFTLIELLAVIVILAIIALIATPIILGVIETARKGAAESSILGYVDAVEKQVMINQIEVEKDVDGVVTNEITFPATHTIADLTGLGVSVKGDIPVEGNVILGNDGSVITGTCFKISVQGKDYKVTYDGANSVASDWAVDNTCS